MVDNVLLSIARKPHAERRNLQLSLLALLENLPATSDTSRRSGSPEPLIGDAEPAAVVCTPGVKRRKHSPELGSR